MIESYDNICGVVLAGGKSSRYNGINKALLKIEDLTFYENIIRILETTFEKTIVITNSPNDLPKDNIPKYHDVIKDIGPLGGIHTALMNTKGFDAIFIVGIDMPFINKEIIREMSTTFNQQDVEVLIPRIEENIEPLSAIYSISILAQLSDYLDTGNDFSIRNFLKIVNTQFFELEATIINKKSFININSQDNYNNYLNHY